MSWLVSSIANSLKLEDDGDEDATKETGSADGNERSSSGDNNDELSPSDTGTPRRGVKEDLSEFSKTFTRQFWGVASFLAPPTADSQISDPKPQSSNRPEIVDQDDSDSVGIGGIRSDLSEIGGRFRTGISKLSNHKAVSEFTKIASEFIQFVSEEGKTVEDYAQQGVIGITDEVVAFARDVATHPETWLDFPMPDEDEKEDFDMSDTQQEHALAVERLAPALAALRMELCPGYMTEASFWKIYFMLVHPRLTKHDAELLSASQVARARERVTQGLHDESQQYESGRNSGTVSSEGAGSLNEEHPTVPSNDTSESVPVNMSVVSLDTLTRTANAPSVEKYALASTEIPVTEDNNGKLSSDIVSKGNNNNGDEDGDEWLKEEPQGKGNSSGTAIPIEDDDISFSDLEEEDEDQPTRHKNAVSKDSNDWLDIEDIDAA